MIRILCITTVSDSSSSQKSDIPRVPAAIFYPDCRCALITVCARYNSCLCTCVRTATDADRHRRTVLTLDHINNIVYSMYTRCTVLLITTSLTIREDEVGKYISFGKSPNPKPPPTGPPFSRRAFPPLAHP